MWATKHKLRLNLNKLKEEGITGATLLLLEAPDLAELGVPSGLQRKKVLAAIEQLAASTASADTVSMRSHTEMADGRNELDGSILGAPVTPQAPQRSQPKKTPSPTVKNTSLKDLANPSPTRPPSLKIISPRRKARRANDDGEAVTGKQYKVLVIGDSNVGKTSIIKRYAHGTFTKQYRATVGVDFALKILNVGEETVRLQLWDIAGQEQFGSMTRVYYKHAVGAFVVVDLTAEQPLLNVAAWKNDLDLKTSHNDGTILPAVLLANKCDSEKSYNNCTARQIAEMSDELRFAGWYEVSAKENVSIQQAAHFLVQNIMRLAGVHAAESPGGTVAIKVPSPGRKSQEDSCCA